MNKKTMMAGALVVATIAGAAVGSSLNALQSKAADIQTAQVNTDTTVDSTASPQPDPSKGGHVGANGVKEELLTGDSATKAKAAALAAVPGGIVERVETDAEGAAYEAHMKKADGSRVTVKFDSNFNVTTTEAGR